MLKPSYCSLEHFEKNPVPYLDPPQEDGPFSLHGSHVTPKHSSLTTVVLFSSLPQGFITLWDADARIPQATLCFLLFHFMYQPPSASAWIKWGQYEETRRQKINHKRIPLWKGYILYKSNYITFWTKQKLEMIKISLVSRGCGGGKDEEAEHTGCLGQWNLYTTKVDPCPDWTLIETTDFGWLWWVTIL